MTNIGDCYKFLLVDRIYTFMHKLRVKLTETYLICKSQSFTPEQRSVINSRVRIFIQRINDTFLVCLALPSFSWLRHEENTLPIFRSGIKSISLSKNLSSHFYTNNHFKIFFTIVRGIKTIKLMEYRYRSGVTQRVPGS
jgi:hypothetical protein